MLNALYRYALEHALTARPGFKEKRVACYCMLTRDGRFLGMTEPPTPTTYAPDIGSKANGDSFCNILIEKACYPLEILTGDRDAATRRKHAYYLSAIESGAAHDPLFASLHAALTDEATLQQMREALLAGHKPNDPIGFEVDGCPMERSEAYLEWWDAFRAQFTPQRAGQALPRCLITGAPAPAMETVPKVTGLISVGGHTSGDAFLCFDKDAFQSFGLKKSANAPVSEEAMTTVNAALRALIAKASTLGGAKMVYWYDKELNAQDDPLDWLLEVRFDEDDESPEAEADDEEADEEEVDADNAQRERDAETSGKRLMEALKTGEAPERSNARYHILPLSGMSGRVMVRGWYEGSFDSLYDNTLTWFDDLRLISPFGRGETRPPKLKELSKHLLKPGGDPKKLYERMDKELSALLGRLFGAIISGAPLPDAVAAKALCWLRSSILTANDPAKEGQGGRFRNETKVYQLLKAWLRREQRARGVVWMESKLNGEYPGVAYHCGRLMAVYAAIQQKALGKDIGAGVVERYYASASTSPNLVLGKLATLSNHHLAKMGNWRDVVFYNRMLGEICTQIGQRRIPGSLSMEEQTEFALGYYQQRAAIYAPRGKADDAETDTATETKEA